MSKRNIFIGMLIAASLLATSAPPTALGAAAGPIEPQAGSWRTWVLTSGSQFRAPPPPDSAGTAAELAQVKTLASQRDAASEARIAFWDAGAPGYRWNEILRAQALQHGVATVAAGTIRQEALLNVAIYDATIAAWDSKYTYTRARPGALDATLNTAVPTPASPSYPSEHAAVAGAAATVLAYLFPDQADALSARADEAALSRVEAGVQFPSDTAAGLEMGRKVGQLVVERGRSDGFETPWTGTIPTGPGLWSLDGYPAGSVPAFPSLATSRPWVLESPSVLRPAPPPAYDSEQKLAELQEIKDFSRTFTTISTSFYWQSPRSDWMKLTDERIAEYHMDSNPPRAARIEALVGVAGFDTAVACFDAKYTYWAARPFQLDPEVKPLFQTPLHPSYPAAHGCVSGAQGTVLATLFPAERESLRNLSEEAAMSRMWGGIHFRSDIDAGLSLGRAVAERVISSSRSDGADQESAR